MATVETLAREETRRLLELRKWFDVAGVRSVPIRVAGKQAEIRLPEIDARLRVLGRLCPSFSSP